MISEIAKMIKSISTIDKTHPIYLKYAEAFKEALGEVPLELAAKYFDKYDQYKSRAKKSGLMFALSIEQFYMVCTARCYVCNRDGKKVELGVDRMNNTKGYVYTNVAPCCWDCNRMKSDMTIVEFKEYVKGINPNHYLVTGETPKSFYNK